MTGRKFEMTERKFTPPTEFPAEYVTRSGYKAVIQGPMPHRYYAYSGYEFRSGDECLPTGWTKSGAWHHLKDDSAGDLFDIMPEPQKQVHWANDYGRTSVGFWHDTREKADDAVTDGRIAVIRREQTGEVVQYFAEKA